MEFLFLDLLGFRLEIESEGGVGGVVLGLLIRCFCGCKIREDLYNFSLLKFRVFRSEDLG